MDKIAGTWSAGGKITGDSVMYHFNASWELNHQFMVLSFADTAANPQYIAKVYIGYDCISERYVCHWLDNFGGRFSETLGYGTLTGNTVEFRFEYPDGPFITGLYMMINVIPGKCTPPQKTVKVLGLLSGIFI